MRRFTLVASALLLLGAVFLLPRADAGSGCTISGTSGDDKLAGSIRHDVICAKGGQDYVNGRAGADVESGAPGGDTLVGGDGADIIRGGAGPDEIFAVDQTSGDQIYGGHGRDKCYVDVGDEVHACEHTVRV